MDQKIIHILFFTGQYTSLRLLGGSRCSRKKTEPETVKDYSIIVPTDASRDEIIAKIFELKGLTSVNRSVTQLKQTLCRYLREKHPIHGQCQTLFLLLARISTQNIVDPGLGSRLC